MKSVYLPHVVRIPRSRVYISFLHHNSGLNLIIGPTSAMLRLSVENFKVVIGISTFS